MENDEQKQTEQTVTPEAADKKTPKQKKWLVPTIIGAVIVIVLALCGGGYYYHFTHTMKDYMPNSYVTFKQEDSKETVHFLGETETNKVSGMNKKMGVALAKNGKFYNLKKGNPSKESVASFIKGKKALGTYEFKGNDQLILHFNIKGDSTFEAIKDAGVKLSGKTLDFKFTDMKGSLQKGLNGKSNMHMNMDIKGLNAKVDINGKISNMKVTRR